MAVKVRGEVHFSGTLSFEFMQSASLATADIIVPDELASEIRSKILLISGVDDANVRCAAPRLEEVNE